MSKPLTLLTWAVALPLCALLTLFGQETKVEEAPAPTVAPPETAPPQDPPHIVVASAIDDESLTLVSFKPVYVGFTGESYNSRSVSKTPLKGVRIFTVKGQPVSVNAARKILAGKDTPVLCSSWATPLPRFYASMFSPDTLHFVFAEEAPAWKKIQEPGRPVR